MEIFARGSSIKERMSQMATKVVVHRRWPWQQDDFYSEREIAVTVLPSGGLMIGVGDDIVAYNSGHWRKVRYNKVSSKAQV